MRLTTNILVVLISLMLFVPSQAQSKDSADLAAVKQVEQDMGNAMIAGDVAKLSQLYADDYASFGSPGGTTTKRDLLTDFASFHDKLEWFENGPIDVQVFGNLALAQGLVKEKRNHNGKDTSGQFLWQDLLQKRAGKWVVWRSGGARVALADSPREPYQGSMVAQTIKQFEQNSGDAMVAVNIDKINQAYGDDWANIGSSGKVFSKEDLLDDFKSGNHKLMSFELGPMDVQVVGDVAVVQTSVTEKRIQDGKDISGQFLFMDLLKKRSGRWVIVRTLGAKLS